MPKYITQKEAFMKCNEEGKIIITEEVDIERIKSTILIAEADIESAEIIKKNIPKQSNKWNSVYKLYYDALHELVESFLKFDKIKTSNHQCLFSYLCEKHPELEFNWEFYEKIRTKRNGINYYGKAIDFYDWKEIELQIIIYIQRLKKEIQKRL
ncbi:MAG: hypothetical protein Q8Q35_00260 [Nanoarchaeota archaeon]|nr:hypothetical protein [Nanoarchaeota archaeon]